MVCFAQLSIFPDKQSRYLRDVPCRFTNTIFLIKSQNNIFLIIKTEVVPACITSVFCLFYKFFIDKKLGKMHFDVIFAKEVYVTPLFFVNINICHR